MAKNRGIKACDIGMIGLGVMGRNLLLNAAGRGFASAGYDTDPEKIKTLEQEGRGLPLKTSGSLEGFVALLRRPRAIIILVPAGTPVDSVIGSVSPLLEKGDLLIDAGNSHYKDTERRAAALNLLGLRFIGAGISGGERGARLGPSIMAGGCAADYARVKPLFETIAARASGKPCAALLGPGGSGHFVKMVHNGIEYAFMQLIAETYDLMKRGLNLNNEQLRATYSRWAESELNSYLLEITAEIFGRPDTRTGSRLIDKIRGTAAQKGTGMWAASSAMELGAPVPTISAAVSMRSLSSFREGKSAAGTGAAGVLPGRRETNIKNLRGALYAAMMISYAQGLSLLSAASRSYSYGLKPGAIAGVWRGGCIIRSTMLENIRTAYIKNPRLADLLLDRGISGKILARQNELRAVVSCAALAGLPAPAFMSALSYLDARRSGWLPANLIQAQRDYFGAHTYERTDAAGVFHTDWAKK